MHLLPRGGYSSSTSIITFGPRSCLSQKMNAQIYLWEGYSPNRLSDPLFQASFASEWLICSVNLACAASLSFGSLLGGSSKLLFLLYKNIFFCRLDAATLNSCLWRPDPSCDGPLRVMALLVLNLRYFRWGAEHSMAYSTGIGFLWWRICAPSISASDGHAGCPSLDRRRRCLLKRMDYNAGRHMIHSLAGDLPFSFVLWKVPFCRNNKIIKSTPLQ